MIGQVAEWLNQNPWLNLVFLVLAVLSIILSLALYIKSKRERRPCFNLRTFQLIQDSISKIEAVQIRYQGQIVPNLSMTKLALWNAGREAINSQDIAAKDPLRIAVAPQAILLCAEIIYVTNPLNNFSIRPDLSNGEVRIDFDYFHKGEGVVFTLYHTGRDDQDVGLKGTVKGVPRIVRASPGVDPLTDSFVKSIDARLGRIKPRTIRYPIAVLFFPFVLCVMIVLLIIDKLTAPMRRAPGQLTLS